MHDPDRKGMQSACDADTPRPYADLGLTHSTWLTVVVGVDGFVAYFFLNATQPVLIVCAENAQGFRTPTVVVKCPKHKPSQLSEQASKVLASSKTQHIVVAAATPATSLLQKGGQGCRCTFPARPKSSVRLSAFSNSRSQVSTSAVSQPGRKSDFEITRK
jgi:hypothetical protein